MVGQAPPRCPDITKTSAAMFLPRGERFSGSESYFPGVTRLSGSQSKAAGFFVSLRSTEIRAARQRQPHQTNKTPFLAVSAKACLIWLKDMPASSSTQPERGRLPRAHLRIDRTKRVRPRGGYCLVAQGSPGLRSPAWSRNSMRPAISSTKNIAASCSPIRAATSPAKSRTGT